ncbi:trypsin-like peptidase domain-containing protein [bacterium]|nr:trypsin-like peptidase domain-containing protein [bacterium]
MSTTRITTTVILACLVGLLAGFGIGNLPRQHALANVLAASGDQSPAGGQTTAGVNFAQPAANPAEVNAASTTGVGGSFVTDVYKKVSPAVVHITNRATYEGFDFFLRPQQIETESTGSGVIVESSGYILTNHHVAANANEILVVLNDGREFTAKVIGSDPGTDLALLKIDADSPLPTATLGDSASIEVGEWVVAIGNPRGLDWTVTCGVISALNRESISQTGQTMTGLIQTDASINPGNSGGPLLNARGEIIGINEMIISGSGGSEGIGLAVPINTAKEVLEDLIQHGRVIRAWLGVSVKAEVSPQSALRYNLPVDYGVVVGNVFESSPALHGNLKPYVSDRRRNGQFRYDIITQVAGERVDSQRKLLDLIRAQAPGDSVDIELYRITNGQYEVLNTTVVVEALPADAPLIGVI